MLGRRYIALAGMIVALGSVSAAGTAASASAATTPAAHLAGTGPMIRPGTPMVRVHGVPRNSVTSTNWSGYAASGSTYTSVSSYWTQPTGTCSSGDQYAAFWVGLDGYSSSTVEQTGSEVDCIGGSPQYYSWYEMYPADPVNFSNTVEPGDQFYGSVTYNGGSSYTLVLEDLTQGWSHTVNASLSGAANSSAEAIVEAPCCTAAGNPLNLTDFHTVNFTNTEVDGSPIGDYSPTQIIMTDESGRDRDSVSSLSNDENWSATWIRKN
jgi:hypothetical protein